MAVDAPTELMSEVARLKDSIDRAAAAASVTLGSLPVASRADDRQRGLAQHSELCRQLAALRERVAWARGDDPRALRSELATLLFFAKTLEADAAGWRAGILERVDELRRQEDAARAERERSTAEREALVRRRDALRLAIDQTAARIAQECGGECRRTLPVVVLGNGVTVCSMTVARPRRLLRFAKSWLVTPDDRHDAVLVRSE